MMRDRWFGVGVVWLGIAAGCSEPAGPTDSGRADSVADGVGTSDGALFDAAMTDGAMDAGGAEAGGCSSCAPPRRCVFGVCIADLGRCGGNDDCPGDSYCDVEGVCVPYGLPAMMVNDPMCRRERAVESIVPSVQCAWARPPMGDPTAAYAFVYNSPMVADLNLDGTTRRIEPSILMTTFASQSGSGVLRVFSGRTCEEQMRVGFPQNPSRGDEPAYGAHLAIGDLDGDLLTIDDRVTGHPEIVTYRKTPPLEGAHTPIQLIAYRIVDQPGMTPPWRLERHWIGRRCDQPGEPAFNLGGPTPWSSTFNAGPSLVDLDDDGRPRSSPSDTSSITTGVFSIRAPRPRRTSPSERSRRWPTSTTTVRSSSQTRTACFAGTRCEKTGCSKTTFDRQRRPCCVVD